MRQRLIRWLADATASTAPAHWSSAAATLCCRCCSGGGADRRVEQRCLPGRLRCGAGVPGPLFTFAAYLGALMPTGPCTAGGWTGAAGRHLRAGLPLVIGALPFWERAAPPRGRAAGHGGINAGVVGVLLAALYDPVWTSAIHSRSRLRPGAGRLRPAGLWTLAAGAGGCAGRHSGANPVCLILRRIRRALRHAPGCAGHQAHAGRQTG
jgi:hypothetical protein